MTGFQLTEGNGIIHITEIIRLTGIGGLSGRKGKFSIIIEYRNLEGFNRISAAQYTAEAETGGTGLKIVGICGIAGTLQGPLSASPNQLPLHGSITGIRLFTDTDRSRREILSSVLIAEGKTAVEFSQFP